MALSGSHLSNSFKEDRAINDIKNIISAFLAGNSIIDRQRFSHAFQVLGYERIGQLFNERLKLNDRQIFLRLLDDNAYRRSPQMIDVLDYKVIPNYEIKSRFAAILMEKKPGENFLILSQNKINMEIVNITENNVTMARNSINTFLDYNDLRSQIINADNAPVEIIPPENWSRYAKTIDDRLRPDQIDNVEGLTDQDGRVYINQKNSTTFAIAHEILHSITNNTMKEEIPAFVEAITEYFTCRIYDVAYRKTRGGYPVYKGRTEDLRRGIIANKYTEIDLMQAYFLKDIDALKKINEFFTPIVRALQSQSQAYLEW